VNDAPGEVVADEPDEQLEEIGEQEHGAAIEIAGALWKSIEGTIGTDGDTVERRARARLSCEPERAGEQDLEAVRADQAPEACVQLLTEDVREAMALVPARLECDDLGGEGDRGRSRSNHGGERRIGASSYETLAGTPRSASAIPSSPPLT
jgi:hypothetical protein